MAIGPVFPGQFTGIPERRAPHSRRHRGYRFFVARLVAGVMALSGCATPQVPNVLDESRLKVASIQVRVGDFAPRAVAVADADPTKSAATGAAVGATPGLLGMAAVAPACANPFGAAICAIYMPLFGVFAVAGAGAAGTSAHAAADMKVDAQRAVGRTVSDRTVQQSLVARSIDYGKSVTRLNFIAPSTPALDAPRELATLEIALVKAEVFGGTWGSSPKQYAVSLEGRARLRRNADGAVLADRTYGYLSVARTPKEWSQDDGKRLFAEIDYGQQQLAEWIIDDFFLTMQVPSGPTGSTSPQGDASQWPVNFSTMQGPLPVEPPVFSCHPIQVTGLSLIAYLFPPAFVLLIPDLLMVAGQMATTKYCDAKVLPVTAAALNPAMVDTLRPTLRWGLKQEVPGGNFESTPTGSHSDTVTDAGQLATSTQSNVRYELRIYVGELFSPLPDNSIQHLRSGALAYQKREFLDMHHVVETDLAPCSHYLWTVRALFESNGATRATEWAGRYWSAQEGDFPPAKLRTVVANNYAMWGRNRPADYAFPFSTPCPAKPEQDAGR